MKRENSWGNFDFLLKSDLLKAIEGRRLTVVWINTDIMWINFLEKFYPLLFVFFFRTKYDLNCLISQAKLKNFPYLLLY